MSDQRLDAAVASRGLARSRTHAARLIADGLVAVDSVTVLKPATRVSDVAEIAVAGLDRYVSRAAHKLISALDGFGIDPAGRTALDAGASTGGFTQVLLERGAVRVIALDVGHGQLDPLIADDSRVVSIEGVNARALRPEDLAEYAPNSGTPDLLVADLSFISLTMVLPALVSSVAHESDFVLLVKPQFEVGRGGVREGIVHDAALREDAVTGVLWAAWDLGLWAAGILPSPILGTHGNREYLVWFRAHGGKHPTEWLERVRMIVGA